MRGVGPSLLALVLWLTACAGEADAPVTDRQPTTTGSPSAPPSSDLHEASISYSYLLTQTCGYGALFGTYAVVERDGVVESVDALGRGNRVRPRDVPTLRDLLAKADKAGSAAKVDLQVDDEGLPILLAIRAPRSQDAAECYVISELDVLDGTTTPAPTENVELSGRWRLVDADIGGRGFSVPSDVNVSLLLRTTSSEAHAVCDVVPLVAHRVDGSDVSLWIGEQRGLPGCAPTTEAPPIPAGDYFGALDAVDHAERTASSLILTGPEVSLSFQRG